MERPHGHDHHGTHHRLPTLPPGGAGGPQYPPSLYQVTNLAPGTSPVVSYLNPTPYVHADGLGSSSHSSNLYSLQHNPPVAVSAQWATPVYAGDSQGHGGEAPLLPADLCSFSSVSQLSALKRFAAFIRCSGGQYLVADAEGHVRGDSAAGGLWEVFFFGETNVAGLKNVATKKWLTAEKVMGFAGDVTARCPEHQAKTFEQWEIYAGHQQGTFHLRSYHGYYLSVHDPTVRAKDTALSPDNAPSTTLHFALPPSILAPQAHASSHPHHSHSVGTIHHPPAVVPIPVSPPSPGSAQPVRTVHHAPGAQKKDQSAGSSPSLAHAPAPARRDSLGSPAVPPPPTLPPRPLPLPKSGLSDQLAPLREHFTLSALAARLGSPIAHGGQSVSDKSRVGVPGSGDSSALPLAPTLPATPSPVVAKTPPPRPSTPAPAPLSRSLSIREPKPPEISPRHELSRSRSTSAGSHLGSERPVSSYSPFVDSPSAGARSGSRLNLNVSQNKVPMGRYVDERDPSYPLVYALLLGVNCAIQSGLADELADVLTPSSVQAEKVFHFMQDGKILRDFDFVENAPEVFARLRQKYGPTFSDFSTSFSQSFYELGSPGKSGSQFFISVNGRYIIKSLIVQEFNFLLSLLLLYYEHMAKNSDSLLNRYFSLFTIRFKDRTSGGAEITVEEHFVVMENLFPTDKDVSEIYDLKGSTEGRMASPEDRAKRVVILKDLDFRRKIVLGPVGRPRFLQQFLERWNIMDYSLLLLVCKVPPSVVPKPPPRPPPRDRKERTSFFKLNDGGVQGEGEDRTQNGELYYLGIIDLLTPYNWSKMMENKLKTGFNLLKEEDAISCVPAEKYRARFLKYLESITA